MNIIVVSVLVQVWAVLGRPDAPYYYNAPNRRLPLAQTYIPPAAQNYPTTFYGGPLERQPPALVKNEADSLVTVQKHIYVHVAPPDSEELPQKIEQQRPVTTRKHYKIIFVKVPSYPAPSNYVVQPQEQHEKTLIYVLLNKPEEPKEKVQQKVVQKPLDRPEVYFIKYRGKATSPPPPEAALDDATHPNTDDTVVIDSARQGYHYNRPTSVLNK